MPKVRTGMATSAVSREAATAISSLDALWAKVDAARAANVVSSDAPPCGAFIVDDYMKRYGIGRNTAESQLKRLAAIGALESGRFQGVGSDGRMMVRKYWWPSK